MYCLEPYFSWSYNVGALTYLKSAVCRLHDVRHADRSTATDSQLRVDQHGLLHVRKLLWKQTRYFLGSLFRQGRLYVSMGFLTYEGTSFAQVREQICVVIVFDRNLHHILARFAKAATNAQYFTRCSLMTEQCQQSKRTMILARSRSWCGPWSSDLSECTRRCLAASCPCTGDQARFRRGKSECHPVPSIKHVQLIKLMQIYNNKNYMKQNVVEDYMWR